ncbi:hypothetical protein SODALDRAFT_281316 [Sodiomyces alkalinus F11]|uniref:Translocation protein sec66 n=1 Tax=Sodiomyces alkalinus (strain CBS 110278 / VKM F-3762 / F11) TaxID=1314773 RepID=A0A3N2PQI5_SODAK|nr:hypothetical protein SODALDRAFT_281316 [Sodiomyces alkalinus F11]ROT36779.1 hypothetical protein SODALDRAFT_281316 [Sodiomyces alkalinus F11]
MGFSIPQIDWLSLALPVAYLFVLGGSLYTFSTIYRKRKAAQSANLAPWFGPHLQRDIYLSLLHLDQRDDEQGKEKKEASPRIPDSVIRAALLRRAVEDIHRLVQIRTAKQACSALLQKGSVGDDLWQRFQRAEKELEDELRDVVMEANALAPNWGQIIFQSANEIAANTTLREKLDNIQEQTEAEKAWWEKRRAAIQADFMRELDEGDSKDGKSVSASTAPSSVDGEPDAVVVGAAGKKKKGKKN